MKKIIFILFAGFVTALTFNFVEGTETQILKALETADTEKLVSFFGKNTQLELPSFDDFVDKATAKSELDIFFDQNPPSKFTTKHKGQSKDGKGRYLIGELKTTTGIFRVHLHLINDLIEELYIHSKTNISS